MKLFEYLIDSKERAFDAESMRAFKSSLVDEGRIVCKRVHTHVAL